MSLDFEDGIEQINKAEEKSNEDKLFLRWVIGYQVNLSFNDFKGKIKENTNVSNNKNECKEEILANVRNIFKKKVGG